MLAEAFGNLHFLDRSKSHCLRFRSEAFHPSVAYTSKADSSIVQDFDEAGIDEHDAKVDACLVNNVAYDRLRAALFLKSMERSIVDSPDYL